jgi:cation:H+ antiporter
MKRSLVSGAIGLVLLIVAGRLIVSGAKGIGAEFGFDEFVVGVVFVAIGTSVPELATTLISRIRGHDEVGLGTLLGSNVFNGAFIIPIAALLSPMTVDWNEIAISLVFGIVLVALVIPWGGHLLGRPRGGVLLVGYAASVVLLLVTHG